MKTALFYLPFQPIDPPFPDTLEKPTFLRFPCASSIQDAQGTGAIIDVKQQLGLAKSARKEKKITTFFSFLALLMQQKQE